jgi:hypothetical protein
MRAVASALGQIHARPGFSLCLFCDTAFTPQVLPLSWAIVFAARDDPSRAVGHGVCANCRVASGSREQLQARVLQWYRDHVDPSIRGPITPHETTGRA